MNLNTKQKTTISYLPKNLILNKVISGLFWGLKKLISPNIYPGKFIIPQQRKSYRAGREAHRQSTLSQSWATRQESPSFPRITDIPKLCTARQSWNFFPSKRSCPYPIPGYQKEQWLQYAEAPWKYKNIHSLWYTKIGKVKEKKSDKDPNKTVITNVDNQLPIP